MPASKPDCVCTVSDGGVDPAPESLSLRVTVLVETPVVGGTVSSKGSGRADISLPGSERGDIVSS